MLLSISIRNIVLIESLDLVFKDGFSVLTGETGAGKSILLDALGLTLGKRGEARLVRHGQDKGSVSSVFSIDGNQAVKNTLNEHEIDIEGDLILRRTVNSDGKSRAFINDQAVSGSLLQKIGQNLVEIHGQHDQSGLMNNANHLKILDSYIQNDKLLTQVKDVFNQWQSTYKQYQQVLDNVEKARADEEYLRHVLDELTKLSPQPDEEQILADKRTDMINSQKIIDSLNSVLKLLTVKNNVASIISSAERILDRSVAQSGELFQPAIEALDRAGLEVADAISVVQRAANDIDMSNDMLDETEERLFALRAAGRKYNCSVDQLSNYAADVKSQIELLETQDKNLDELYQKYQQYRTDYIKLTSKLTAQRQKYSKQIEGEIALELAPLKMENSRIKIDIAPVDAEKWNPSGVDKVRFLVRTNAGSPFAELGKIASGGELSRLMLALKVVLSKISSVPTLIFDEIDTGIGGAVADSVGKRLGQLGGGLQVFCVTHQPQVASYGDNHLFIEKSDKSGMTTTNIIEINDDKRRNEIARMLAGKDISDEARAAADILIAGEKM